MASWPQCEQYLDDYNSVNGFTIKLDNLIKALEFCEKEKKISINYKKSIINLINELLALGISIYFDENTIRLTHALSALLSIPSGQGVLTGDKRHKPQQKSTAEVLIVNCLIAVDAAAIYYNQNKKFPLYHDNEFNRKAYLKIFQKLYESGHHQYVASENAPGAKGFIKSTSFFPGDLKLDASQVLLETQLARLNKPKIIYPSIREKFDHRILKSNLQEIKDKTINHALGANSTFVDWQRNWESYYINGKSVKELREGKEFKGENDLAAFIDFYLLAQIKDQELLKEYYKALILYSFHYRGFPHAFSKVCMESVNTYLAKESEVISQLEVQINLSWSKDQKGIHIEELNTYKEKNEYTGEVLLPKEGKHYCQTQSCVLLKLNETKKGGYKLEVNIQSASVDCVDELKFLFFKKPNLLDTFILYLQSLLVSIKRYFDKFIKKPDPVINESWLSKTNSSFFQKLTASMEEVKTKSQDQLQSCVLSSFYN